MNLQYLENRLQKLVKDWPNNLKADFDYYIDSKKDNSEPKKNNYEFTNQLWFNMVISVYQDIHYERDEEFLKDILWGQYCLLLSLRIKDDLLDEELITFSLLFVSEQLVVEAIKTYIIYFNFNGRFADFFLNSIETSNLTVMKIDHMECYTNTNTEELLKKYTEVLSLFNIGFYAICSRYNKLDLYHKIVEINNSISLSGQIIDDLEDLSEDLDRNRYNYVALMLLDKGLLSRFDKKEHIKNIERNIVINGKLSKVFEKINYYAEKAKSYCKENNFHSVYRLMNIYEKNISKLQDYYHQNRVNTVFRILNEVN